MTFPTQNILTLWALLVIVGGGIIGVGGGIVLCKRLKKRWVISIGCILLGIFVSKWAMEHLLLRYYTGAKDAPILVAADGWLMAAFAAMLIFSLWQGGVRRKDAKQRCEDGSG